jgi:SPP1 family predicted phage head-tail adaptor
MPPIAGLLNRRIQIQQRGGSTPDGTGQPSQTWTTVWTVWARVVPIGGAESYRGDQLNPEISDIVTIRWLAGIQGQPANASPLMRVLTDDGRCLDILAVVYGERHITDQVVMHCKERIAWQPLND